MKQLVVIVAGTIQACMIDGLMELPSIWVGMPAGTMHIGMIGTNRCCAAPPAAPMCAWPSPSRGEPDGVAKVAAPPSPPACTPVQCCNGAPHEEQKRAHPQVGHWPARAAPPASAPCWHQKTGWATPAEEAASSSPCVLAPADCGFAVVSVPLERRLEPLERQAITSATAAGIFSLSPMTTTWDASTRSETAHAWAVAWSWCSETEDTS
mmetsp:Transcript_5223/g.15575  ORF Transcript_5223/g.15575 Transcript_5223/m.15575 type:complete len:209 (+) Transcript_5223:169-795(+)